MRIDVIDNAADLAALERDWRAVFDVDPDAQFYLSWAWMSAWFDYLDRLEVPWAVLVARPERDAVPVAFWPIQINTEMTSKGGFYNVIRMAGHALAGYTGFLCRPGAEDMALPAFADAMRGLNWTILYLLAINASPARMQPFMAAFEDGEFTIRRDHRVYDGDETDYSVYPQIRLPGSMEDYLATALGARTRRNARAALRRLDRGEFHVTHADAATIDRDLGCLDSLWTERWGAEKDAFKLRAQTEERRFMARRCFDAGDALVAVLWRDDTPIAVQVRLIDRRNNAVRCMVGARDIAVRQPAPGFLLNLHCIRWAIENGFALYDMQVGNHRYKYDFGPEDYTLDSSMVTTASRRNLRDRLEPRTLPVVWSRVRALHAEGKTDHAALGCRQILLADSAHREAYALLARIEGEATRDPRVARARALLQAGDAQAAERLLHAAVQRRGDDFDARYLLGLAQAQRQDYAAAKPHFTIAASLRPQLPVVHNNLGACLLALGQAEQAVGAFDRAIALDPGYTQARTNRQRALREMERTPAHRSYDRGSRPAAVPPSG